MITSPFNQEHLHDVLDHLNEQFAGHLYLRYTGRTVAAKLTGPDAELLLSSLDPIRPQLVAELLRLGRFCNYLATVIADSDECDAEGQAHEHAETMIDLFDTGMTSDVLRRVSA